MRSLRKRPSSLPGFLFLLAWLSVSPASISPSSMSLPDGVSLPENLLNSYLECKAQEARNYAAERDPYRYELETYFRCI